MQHAACSRKCSRCDDVLQDFLQALVTFESFKREAATAANGRPLEFELAIEYKEKRVVTQVPFQFGVTWGPLWG
jgi:hypothetical protein